MLLKTYLQEVPMQVVELTKENFEQVVTSNPTVIVDYWAPWCGPCRGFAPVFEKVAEKHPDVVFAKVNTEDEQEIAAHFQIRSIPTLMVFREQIIVFSQPGALPQAAFEQVVEKVKELDMDEVRRQLDAQEQDQGKSAAG
jgi:thioredoxin 1